MLTASRLQTARPFTSAVPAGRRSFAPVCAVRKPADSKLVPARINDDVDLSSAGTSVQGGAQRDPQLRTRSFEASQGGQRESFGRGGGDDRRGRRDGGDKTPPNKHFLPLPKPAHLVYIKPTVAVVTDVASRSSVGIKMTAGVTALERYVIEYYARSVK